MWSAWPLPQLFGRGSAQTQTSYLPCGHIFHQACVIRWLEVRQACPKCQRGFDTANGNGDGNGNANAAAVGMAAAVAGVGAGVAGLPGLRMGVAAGDEGREEEEQQQEEQEEEWEWDQREDALLDDTESDSDTE